MKNINIKPSEALPTIETTLPARGHRGSYDRSQQIQSIQVNSHAHEYGQVREVTAHLPNSEYDRAFVLNWSGRIFIDFTKTTTTEEGVTERNKVGTTISKAEARQLRDRLNSLDLDE